MVTNSGRRTDVFILLEKSGPFSREYYQKLSVAGLATGNWKIRLKYRFGKETGFHYACQYVCLSSFKMEMSYLFSAYLLIYSQLRLLVTLCRQSSYLMIIDCFRNKEVCKTTRVRLRYLNLAQKATHTESLASKIWCYLHLQFYWALSVIKMKI